MRSLSHELVSLIHYVELTRAGWQVEMYLRSVLAVLWLYKGIAHPKQIRKEILQQLGIDLKKTELDRVLQSLAEDNQIVKVRDGRIRLAESTIQELKLQTESAQALEQKVKEIFSASLAEHCPSLDHENTWTLFVEDFLVPLVESEGARAYELLTGGKTAAVANASYIEIFLHKIPTHCQAGGRDFLGEFLTSEVTEIRQFLLSYLDAYFLVSAAGLSRSVVERLVELCEGAVEFVVFVDTNFVFSILGLHDNPANEAAQDVLDLAASLSENVSVKFVIRNGTVEETRNSIVYNRKQLDQKAYPSNLAQAAKSSEISGLQRAFFERVASSGMEISAEEFFSPYEDDLVRILSGRGIEVFQEDQGVADSFPRSDLDAEIDSQVDYEERVYGERAKSRHQIIHDVTLWHAVQDLRMPRMRIPLQSKFWIVTVDFRFINFDRYKTRVGNTIPACMSPAQLIQVLRFFVPRSEQLERALLGALRLPVSYRQFGSEAEQVTQKIARRLNRHEGIEDLETDTLIGVFADDHLRDCLSEATTEEEETELIESALVRQLKRHERELKLQGRVIADLQSNVESLDGTVEALQAKQFQLQEDAQKAGVEKQTLDQTSTQLKKDLDKIQRERDRYVFWLKLLGALGILVIGGLLVFVAPEILQWQWLLQHERKLGLQLGFFYVFIATSLYMLFSNKTLRISVAVAFLADAALVIAQII